MMAVLSAIRVSRDPGPPERRAWGGGRRGGESGKRRRKWSEDKMAAKVVAPFPHRVLRPAPTALPATGFRHRAPAVSEPGTAGGTAGVAGSWCQFGGGHAAARSPDTWSIRSPQCGVQTRLTCPRSPASSGMSLRERMVQSSWLMPEPSDPPHLRTRIA
ncbi:hypothetical protein STEG23_023303 [Scotinomys teguina]